VTAALAFITGPVGRWLLGAVAIVAVLGGVYLKGRSDGEAKIEAAVAEANRKADAKAAALSTDLLIEQVKAMGATAKKADSYVAKIKAAPDGDRDRLTNRGVRDLIHGAPDAPK